MVALQIRDVPDEVRDRLANAAARHGQSLQAYLLEMVNAEARRDRNRELIASLRGRTDGTQATLEDSMNLKHELRAERDRQILGDDHVDET
jgi:plasmid stability protein